MTLNLAPVGPRDAPCPVRGCGQDIPVRPDLAYQPVHCPCQRRERLTTGLSGTGAWVLRPSAYDQEERADHNAIIHALIAGQAVNAKRKNRPDTAPDPVAADLIDAVNARTRAANDIERYLLSGDLSRAVQAAEIHAACRVAVKLLTRNYKSQRRREEDRSGLWHRSAEFYIEQTSEHDTHVRLAFAFEAMYVDETLTTSEETGVQVKGKPTPVGTTLRVVNARTIEMDSGVPVGDEGWRQLIRLLQRTEEGKPGQPASPRELIWRRNPRGDYDLRRHVKSHYPQALVALEALRRSLHVPDFEFSRLQADQFDLFSALPEWVTDAMPELWTDIVQPTPLPSVQKHNEELLTLQRGIKPKSGRPRARR